MKLNLVKQKTMGIFFRIENIWIILGICKKELLKIVKFCQFYQFSIFGWKCQFSRFSRFKRCFHPKKVPFSRFSRFVPTLSTVKCVPVVVISDNDLIFQCNKFQCIPSMLYFLMLYSETVPTLTLSDLVHFRQGSPRAGITLCIKMALPSEKTAFSEKNAFSIRKKIHFH